MKAQNTSDIRFHQTPGARSLPVGAMGCSDPESAEQQPVLALEFPDARVKYP